MTILLLATLVAQGDAADSGRVEIVFLTTSAKRDSDISLFMETDGTLRDSASHEVTPKKLASLKSQDKLLRVRIIIEDDSMPIKKIVTLVRDISANAGDRPIVLQIVTELAQTIRDE